MGKFKDGDIVTVVHPDKTGAYTQLVGKPLTVLNKVHRDSDLTWFTGGGDVMACFTWRLDYYNLNLENK